MYKIKNIHVAWNVSCHKPHICSLSHKNVWLISFVHVNFSFNTNTIEEFQVKQWIIESQTVINVNGRYYHIKKFTYREIYRKLRVLKYDLYVFNTISAYLLICRFMSTKIYFNKTLYSPEMNSLILSNIGTNQLNDEVIL